MGIFEHNLTQQLPHVGCCETERATDPRAFVFSGRMVTAVLLPPMALVDNSFPWPLWQLCCCCCLLLTHSHVWSIQVSRSHQQSGCRATSERGAKGATEERRWERRWASRRKTEESRLSFSCFHTLHSCQQEAPFSCKLCAKHHVKE